MSLLSKNDAGVYYVVVPADVKLAVYNGSKLMKSTKNAGLTAGKYYTLLTGETTGSATNKLGDTINWVQLWAGGPKFATKNVAEEMTWYDAKKTDDDFAWGKNWRTPTIDEVCGEGKLNCTWNEKYEPIPVAGSPYFELKEQNGYQTVVFTGVQPGYTKNTLTLYDKAQPGTHHFDFWTASENTGYGVRFFITAYEDGNEVKITGFGKSPLDNKNKKYWVRPVLAE